MASSSSQGCEPSSGFVLPVNDGWKIKEFSSRPFSFSKLKFPVRKFPATHSDTYEALTQTLNDPSANGNMGFVQFAAREIVAKLLAPMGEIQLEYDSFLQSQNLSMDYKSLRSFQKSPSCKFLLEGPPVQGNFEDPRWVLYSNAVRKLLLKPENRDWLEQDLHIFLVAAGLLTDLETNGGLPDIPRVPELPFDEESQDDEHAGEEPIQASTSWRQIVTLLVGKLFNCIAMVVFILNVTAALGYVILMNDPAPPRSSYIIGTLLTWFLTTAILIGYGSFTTGSMKDYARRLLILAIFTCFVVAVVFHFAGASNFAASFLVGITMTILLIQIW